MFCSLCNRKVNDMDFTELMKGLSVKLGGTIDLTPDETGSVTLGIDDAKVMLLDMGRLLSVALYASVAVPPPADRLDRLYQSLLEANHAFSETSGATLSLNNETGEIYLCRILPYASLDADGFAAVLDGFVDTHGKWRKLIEDFRGGVAADAQAAPADDLPMGFMQV